MTPCGTMPDWQKDVLLNVFHIRGKSDSKSVLYLSAFECIKTLFELDKCKKYEYFRLSIVSSYKQLDIYIFGGMVVAHGMRTNYFDHICQMCTMCHGDIMTR